MITSAFESRYKAFRELYPDAVLLFSVGDFFELYHDNARTCAASLGLSLVTRNKGTESPIPMAGFPYHQLAAYVAKLCANGQRVAVVNGDGVFVHPGPFLVTGCEIFNDDGARVFVATTPRKAAAMASTLSGRTITGETSPADVSANNATKETATSETAEQHGETANNSAPLIGSHACEESPGVCAELEESQNEEPANDDDSETEEPADDSAPVAFLKWQSTAGPRQTKTAVKAISDFQSYCKYRREVNDSGTWLTMNFGASPCRAGVLMGNAIHAAHGGTITAKNYKEIAATYEAAKAAVELPTIDNRTTPEQRAQLAKERAELDAKRKIEAEKEAAQKQNHVEELRAAYPWAVGPEKFKTGAARAAANIREELKRTFPGVTFKVTSETFSMGDSVDIRWNMGPAVSEVRKITDKYKDGHFCGMQDLHEYDGSAYGRAVETVLGRAKYVSPERADSWELKKKLAPMVCELLNVPCEAGMDSDIYKNGCGGDLRRLLCDIVDGHSFPPGVTVDDITGVTYVENPAQYSERYRLVYSVSEVAANVAEPTAENSPQNAGAFTIETHHHTKRGADFFLVVPANHLETSVYYEILSAARARDGWQSRKFGRIPSGFGFETREAAEKFVAFLTGTPQAQNATTETGTGEPSTAEPQAANSSAPPISSPAPAKSPGNIDKATAERLRALAEPMTQVIKEKTAPLSQNWTVKRGREHGSRVIEGERLRRVQAALFALADAWEAGTVPPILRGLKTKTAVYELCANRMDTSRNGEYYDSGEPGNNSPAAVALRALVDSKRTDEHNAAEEIARKKNEIQRAENALRAANCPGFFPSPPGVCNSLGFAADIPGDIPEGFRILEPSAGIGSICEAITEKTNATAEHITAVEIRQSMADIIALKGFAVQCADFLELSPDDLGTFDRVVMNPPFEKAQDVAHVRHAFQFVKPGGVLAAVVSAGVTFRTDAVYSAFREWFEELGGILHELPAGSFTGADAFRQTGVNAYRLTITAPGVLETIQHSEAPAAAQHCEEPAHMVTESPEVFTVDILDAEPLEAATIDPEKRIELRPEPLSVNTPTTTPPEPVKQPAPASDPFADEFAALAFL